MTTLSVRILTALAIVAIVVLSGCKPNVHPAPGGLWHPGSTGSAVCAREIFPAPPGCPQWRR